MPELYIDFLIPGPPIFFLASELLVDPGVYYYVLQYVLLLLDHIGPRFNFRG